MTLRVLPVDGFFGRLAFLKAAARLRHEPLFTPDLSLDFLHTTSPKNPFFKTAETQFFIARRDGKITGRLSVTLDKASNERHHESVVTFGHFEVANGDSDTTQLLIQTAEDFGRARGMKILRGPIDLSMNYRVGLLIEGFDLPPAIQMPWNPPGHAALLESCGLTKIKDLLSLQVTEQTIHTERYERIAARALERGGYTLRPIQMSKFEKELELFHRVYNVAWADNWGFVPMTYEELLFVAKPMKDIIRPELVVVAERKGELAGFALAVPDVAIAIREIGGRLFPFGAIKLLRRIKSIDRLRVMTLGVLPEHRATGLDAAIYAEISRKGRAAGIRFGEFGWMLEDNLAIVSPLLSNGSKVTKRYRVYEKLIG